MRNFCIAVLLAISLAIAGCRDMQPKPQDWVVSAPEKTPIGISCNLGWILEKPELRKLVTSHPMFDQALELFLDRAQLDPSSETGRVSAYLLKFPNKDDSNPPIDSLRKAALIQIAGFRDPKAIQKVVAESFPPEGTLKLGNREYPLFVVLDINQFQIRILSDSEGRLWIGDMGVLQEIAKRRTIGDGSPVSRAFEWVSNSGAVQGFVVPDLVPKEILNNFLKVAPEGIKGLAWSVSPSSRDEQIIDFDLAVDGTEEAITKLKPWMQRLIVLVSSSGNNGTRQPETLQENSRMGIRCQFRQDQLSDALNMLDLQEIVQLPVNGGFTTSSNTK